MFLTRRQFLSSVSLVSAGALSWSLTGPSPAHAKLETTSLRIVEDGLHPDDWVVVGGIQRAIPGSKVAPQRITMPGAPTEPAAPAAPVASTTEAAPAPAAAAAKP